MDFQERTSAPAASPQDASVEPAPEMGVRRPAPAQPQAPLPAPPGVQDLLAPQGERPPSASELAFGQGQAQGAADRAAGTCILQLGQQVESVVTSVSGDHPVFTNTLRIPLAQMWEQLRSLGTVTEADLRQVLSVGMLGPDASTCSFVLSADSLVITVAGLSGAQNTNACGFQLELGGGRILLLQAHATAFHTDTTEWSRHGIRKSIAGLQDEIARYTDVQEQDQAKADHPAPADVSHEEADLAQKAASLAAVDGQMHQQEAGVRARFDADSPVLQGAVTQAALGTAGGDGVAQIEATAAQYQKTAGTLGNLGHDLAGAQASASQLHSAAQTLGQVPPDLQQDIAEADARVQTLTTQRDALAAQLATQRDALNRLLDAQADGWDQVLADYQASFGKDSGLKDLLASHLLLRDGIASLRRAITAKQDEAAKEAVAAKGHAQNDAATIADVQKRLGEAQAALAALKGPVYVTFGENGQTLPDAHAPGA